MQALATLAGQRDIRISKHLVDEVVHGWFFKAASLTRLATELGRTSDFLSQEIGDICTNKGELSLNDSKTVNPRHTNTPVLPTDEPSRNTLALYLLTGVYRGVCVILWGPRALAFLERAVERLYFGGPELEGTF